MNVKVLIVSTFLPEHSNETDYFSILNIKIFPFYSWMSELEINLHETDILIETDYVKKIRNSIGWSVSSDEWLVVGKKIHTT